MLEILRDSFRSKKEKEIIKKIKDALDGGLDAPCAVFESLKHEEGINENTIQRFLSKYNVKKEDYLNYRYHDGSTLLHTLAGSPFMVNFLIKQGFDVNEKNNVGDTPAFLATCLPQGLESLKILHENGADLKIINNQGQNILSANINDHNPPHRNLTKTLRYAVDNGVNPYIPDRSGKSAFNKAKETGKTDLIELFEKYSLDNKENQQKNINSQIGNLPPLSDKTPRKTYRRSSADDNTLLEKKRHHSGKRYVHPGSIS